jgi:hypothetical protein
MIAPLRCQPSLACLALLVGACAPLAANRPIFASATSLCALLQDEAQYAGRQVMVRALLHHSPHGRTINDPNCSASMDLRGSSADWNRRARRVVNGALVGNPRALIPVVVTGMFQPSIDYSRGQRVIHAGGAFLTEARIVAARQP